MSQKQLSWNDIVQHGKGSFSLKKIDPAAKKVGKNKYRNKKVIIDGIKFDSTLEGYMYRALKLHKLQFDMKPKWELLEAFTYDGKNIRAIGLEPDFVIEDDSKKIIAVVDTKGMITPEWKIKIKILKSNFKKGGTIVPIFTPKSQAECQKTIIQLKHLLNK